MSTIERANNLHQSGDLEGARSAYRAVLQQEPKNVSALNLLGVVELKLGDYASAAATIAVAERISPSVSSRNNLAMALAGEGAVPTCGFRSAITSAALPSTNGAGLVAPRIRVPDKPLWLGQHSLADKTILLHAEQGLGDTIQFVRYARRLAREADKVLVLVLAPPPLVRLLATLGDDVAVTDWLPRSFGRHCPLMSLPLACRTTLMTVPAEVPYLRADRVLVVAAAVERRGPVGRPGLVGQSAAGPQRLSFVAVRRGCATVLAADSIRRPAKGSRPARCRRATYESRALAA